MAKADEEEFEISDEIVEKEEESTEQQKDDIFYAIILGKQITKTIHTSRGDFVVKFPKEKDRTAIDLLEASRRGGVPVESLTVQIGIKLQNRETKTFHGGICQIRNSLIRFSLRHGHFFRKCSQCFQTIKNQKIQKRLTKKTFLKLWAAVYFRVLPQQVNAIDEDYLELVYNFANTYTEEGIREWYRDINKEDSNTEDSTDNLLDLGYTWKEILEMQGTDNQENE